MIINGQEQTIPLLGESIEANKENTWIVSFPTYQQVLKMVTNSVLDDNNLAGLSEIHNPNDTVYFAPKLDGSWVKDEIDIDAGRYIELLLKAKEDVYVNQINLDLQASGSQNMQFTLLGSLGRDFADPDSYAVMQTLNYKMLTKYKFNTMVKVPAGTTYRLRLYPWCKDGGAVKYLILNDMTMQGVSIK